MSGPQGYSVLVVASAILAIAGCGQKHPQPVATPPPVVEVARPVERTVTDYQIFTARTQAVQSVDVKARVTGYLNKIDFTDGDLVEGGKSVLFEIDDRTYKATLDQAKASLALANDSLEAAKADLEIAKANLVKTQADYDIGLKIRKDNAGAISEQEIVRRLGARDEAKGGIDKANATIAEAKSSIDKAKATLENAQLYYDWCKVQAPISGRITRHFIDTGNLISQDVTVLANIVSLKPMWAYFNVDQGTVQRVQALVMEGKIKKAREGKVPIEMGVGVGSDQDFPVAGVIDYISNQLDPNTGTIQVRAVFPNNDELLAAGLFARIRVPVSAPHSALLVADQAVGTNQGQKYVLVVNEQDEVEYHAVDVGQVFSGLREVLRFRTIVEPGPDGKDVTRQVEVLKPTDRVIVMGMLRARPGDKVDPRLVDMETLLGKPSPEKKSTPSTASK
jgi:multidrug efflux pump subunit AcrA (membrane-fusion protein)